MSTIKTATSALTAVALVTGISFAWAQTEQQQESTNSTTVAATPSEQTPADPNAAPLVDNSTSQQQLSNTNPPAVDATSPAPQSSDANSQAPMTANGNTSASSSSSISSTNTPALDNSTSATPSADASYNSSTTSSYEPAPRADRN